MLDLVVTDLKQWSYCRRIPFYRYVQPVVHRPTFKMERGRTTERIVAALERRRKLKEYDLVQGERRFGVSLRSATLGLSGKLDLLVVTPTASFPVDFKDTEGGVRRNHRVQLAAYALLVEDSYQTEVPCAFVYLTPVDRIVAVPMNRPDRAAVLDALGAMREMIRRQEIPEPTDVRARCVACEFQNYCADIW
jgi:CRISPR-associated exonuclease Cas4